MTADEAISIVGATRETTIADIVASGATVDDLSKAWFWVNADESLIGASLPSPSGKVAELIDLLARDDDAPVFNAGQNLSARVSGWSSYI